MKYTVLNLFRRVHPFGILFSLKESTCFHFLLVCAWDYSKLNYKRFFFFCQWSLVVGFVYGNYFSLNPYHLFMQYSIRLYKFDILSVADDRGKKMLIEYFNRFFLCLFCVGWLRNGLQMSLVHSLSLLHPLASVEPLDEAEIRTVNHYYARRER